MEVESYIDLKETHGNSSWRGPFSTEPSLWGEQSKLQHFPGCHEFNRSLILRKRYLDMEDWDHSCFTYYLYGVGMARVMARVRYVCI